MAKNQPPRKPKQTQFNTCVTGVNPMRTHGLGIWGNRRVVMGIRVDEKLKIEATKVLKLLFGSTCRGVEAYLAGLVATYHSQGIHGVNPSNTIDVRIDNLNIERNLKTRRKLIVEENIETVEVKQVKTVKKKQMVVNDLPDYSKMSLEELDKKHRLYQNIGQLGKSALIAAELKRRGVFKK